MEASESSRNRKLPGVPKVTPDSIKAYRQLPISYNEQIEDLKRDNVALARELFIRAEILSNSDIIQKRTFIRGALFMYGLIQFTEQYEQLEALFGPNKPDESSAADGDEVLPPSA